MVEGVELAGSLLDWLHGFTDVPLCPGDWAWTTTALGALIGLLPTIAALLSITIRRVVGNSYGPVTGAMFAVLGVTSTLVLPWVLFSGTFEALQRESSYGMASLSTSPCLAFTQRRYLVDAPPIIRAITGQSDKVFLVAACITAVLALLCLIFVMMQAGSAFRLGPNWPRRVFWPPFLVLLVATSLLPVTLVGHLLLGFFPIALIGSLVVRIFGLTTAMLNRPGRDRGTPATPQQPASSSHGPSSRPTPQQAVSARQNPPPHNPQQHNPQQHNPQQHNPQNPPPYQPAGKPPPYQPAHIPPYRPVPPYNPTPPPMQKPVQPRQYPPTRVA
ncbi:MAG: serine/threonine protein kinase, partial [Saccharothrix sp.]|nr:serine/threonine protein kinase [Saccharothrix sp.]